MGARGVSSEHVENMEMFSCQVKSDSQTLSRDGSKNFNIRTCEHMILGQLTMGARQTKNAPLGDTYNDRWPLECSNMLGAVQKANVLL